MTFCNAIAKQVEFGISDVCIPVGIDKLLRHSSVPDEGYEIARQGRLTADRHFDDKIAQLIFGDTVRHVPIRLGHNRLNLFEESHAERFLLDDIGTWEDALQAARSNRLLTLIHTMPDHVEPFTTLPNGNWIKVEYLEQLQVADGTGQSGEDIRWDGVTAEQLWHDQAADCDKGARGIMLFPPEPSA